MIPLFKNIELKILAFLCAILLWFFVVGIENSAYRFPDDVEVHAINVPQDLSLSTDLGKAKLQVRVDSSLRKNISKNDFDVFVDLKNMHEGEQDAPIRATSKNENVTILKVEPVSVHISLETIAEKEVKINTVTVGNPKSGYVVKDIKLAQETAKIKGGKSLIDKVDHVVAQLTLDGSETSNFKGNLTLQLEGTDSTLTKNIIFTPAQVLADVTISSMLQQKTVVIKPNLVGALDPAITKVETNPQLAVIQGKEEDLKTINSISTTPISVNNINTEKAVTTQLVVPDGITILDPNSTTITVNFKF